MISTDHPRRYASDATDTRCASSPAPESACSAAETRTVAEHAQRSRRCWGHRDGRQRGAALRDVHGGSSPLWAMVGGCSSTAPADLSVLASQSRKMR